MSHLGKALVSLCLMGIAAWVIISALKWPLKTALFPVVIGIPVFLMALAEFWLSLIEKEKVGERASGIDFKLSEDIDLKLANRRALSMFLWIIGFFLLIIFISFPIAIPVFFVLFLKLKGKEGWGISLGLGAVAWGIFYGLFVWLMNIPFMEGWLVRGVRALGIV